MVLFVKGNSGKTCRRKNNEHKTNVFKSLL